MATRNTDMGVLQNKTLRRALFLDQPTQYNMKKERSYDEKKRTRKRRPCHPVGTNHDRLRRDSSTPTNDEGSGSDAGGTPEYTIKVGHTLQEDTPRP